jgi:DNA-binding PadR family transcriptional regulator
MKGERLGEFEELTLLAVMALDAQAYGVSVQALLERETGRDVSLGAVYAALDRMEHKEYVRSSMSESTAERGGKRRRLYEITPAGSRAVREARTTREALWNAIPRNARGRS